MTSEPKIQLNWEFFKVFFENGSVDFKFDLIQEIVRGEKISKTYSLPEVEKLLSELFLLAGMRTVRLEFLENQSWRGSSAFRVLLTADIPTGGFYMENGWSSKSNEHAICDLIYKLLCETGAIRAAFYDSKRIFEGCNG